MSKPLSVLQARARVLASAAVVPSRERVPLELAHGRFLAEPIRTTTPWPATDRAAMDGFALSAGAAGLPAGTTLPVVGESLAGRPYGVTLPRNATIRIMTGAVVPAGADAVVPVEQTSGFEGNAMTLQAAVRPGQHVRKMGSEMQAGQQVLAAGTRLWASEIGALAVLGHAQVPVRTPLRVAIVATGDEVVAVDREPLPHQVRESNSWALAAQVVECGATPLRLGIAPDEPAALRSMLQRGLQQADVLVTIGGISKGTHDLVFGTLAELGVRTEFHGIDLKPGKPTFFGTRTTGPGARFVFGLPGNPASSFTVFDLLVRPMLLALAGAEVNERPATAPVGGAPWLTNARLQAIPARMRAAATGELVTTLVPPSPSGDPFGLLGADHYALIEPQQRAGETTRVAVLGGSAGIVLP